MAGMNYKTATVGAIAAYDYRAVPVFHRYGIDFCCHGEEPFTEACAKAGASVEEVVTALDNALQEQSEGSYSYAFKEWDKDLLMDYILKVHHRGIRREGPVTLQLLDKVASVHGEKHPELMEVRSLFAESLLALEEHLQKEEQVLFPYLYDLFAALAGEGTLGSFHCGSVVHPIGVMLTEHDGEGERYRTIAALTNGYTPPADACESYKLVLQRIARFEQQLHEHIHLENNILFPWAIDNEPPCNWEGQ